MRRQWLAAVQAFEARTYVNELGVEVRADRLEDIRRYLTKRGLTIEAWYGVRVFTDLASPDEPATEGEDFEHLIRAEQLAGSRDPTGNSPHRSTSSPGTNQAAGDPLSTQLVRVGHSHAEDLDNLLRRRRYQTDENQQVRVSVRRQVRWVPTGVALVVV